MIPLLHTAISERFRAAARRSAIQIHVYFTLLYYSRNCRRNGTTNIELDVCLLTDTSALPTHCTPGTTCHQDATCIQVTPHVCACNPANSHRCQCNQGFIGDGLKCTGEHKYFELKSLNVFKVTTPVIILQVHPLFNSTIL